MVLAVLVVVTSVMMMDTVMVAVVMDTMTVAMAAV
jgi:hypothetical protein